MSQQAVVGGKIYKAAGGTYIVKPNGANGTPTVANVSNQAYRSATHTSGGNSSSGGELVLKLSATDGTTTVENNRIRFKSGVYWPNAVRVNVTLINYKGIPDCTGYIDADNANWGMGPQPTFMFDEMLKEAGSTQKATFVTSMSTMSQPFTLRLADSKNGAVTLSEGWAIVVKLTW